MPCRIRDFAPGDREAFEALGTAFYQTDGVAHAIPQENFKKTFDMCMDNSPYVRGLLIECSNRPAGFALLALTYSNEAGGLVVWLEELYLLPESRGQGLVGEFFDFIDAEYRHKAVRYRLEVTKSNVRATEIYKKYGFEMMEYMPMVKELAGQA